jgi:hypothetical protein
MAKVAAIKAKSVQATKKLEHREYGSFAHEPARVGALQSKYNSVLLVGYAQIPPSLL